MSGNESMFRNIGYNRLITVENYITFSTIVIGEFAYCLPLLSYIFVGALVCKLRNYFQKTDKKYDYLSIYLFFRK